MLCTTVWITTHLAVDNYPVTCSAAAYAKSYLHHIVMMKPSMMKAKPMARFHALIFGIG